MEGVLAVLLIFGSPVLIVFGVMYYRYRVRLLAAGGGPVERARLEASERERKLLEARVQNLESIVCSVDFELNQRLNRLAAVTGSMRALPPGPGASKADAAFEATMMSQPVPYALGQLEPGRVVLDRYKVVSELGRGGMGAVYLAEDSALGERVALKVISSAVAADPAQAIARFQREVQSARRVTHPNVIRIHDLGQDGALLFLSMEYVEGETLAVRIKRLGALPLPEASDILRDVAAGVAAAHAAGVVHRDLKPQNVLLGGSSVGAGRIVKVIDFGLATTSFLAGMTATGMILGTPEYMAPEQVRGSTCDARSDVYALGAMAYFALCGRPPFVGETPIATSFAHLQEKPKPPRELRPEIPAHVEAAILRALEKDPSARFLDAAEWGRAIG